MHFSKDQQLAIDTRDRTILVSAAAGSGKTTTLTERIIRSLLDEKNPISLQDMLIVTYTRAAAADLVHKIGAALTKAVKELENTCDGGDDGAKARLERELYLLPAARIKTIDSFCSDIVRSSTKELGIPPNFRIAEEAEIRILSSETLNTLIDSAYEGELEDDGISAKDFDDLALSLTDAKHTGALADVLLSLYDKCKNAIGGVSIFDDYANIYLQKADFKVEDTEYGRDIIKHAKEVLKYVEGGFYALSDALSLGGDAEVSESEHYLATASYISSLVREDYATIRHSLKNLEYPKRGSVDSEDMTELIESMRKREKKLKGKLDTLYKQYFLYAPEMWGPLFERMHKSLTTLARTLHAFDRLYMVEKLRRNMFEYSDIERFAYNTLYDKDGNKTDFALAYAASLDAVYIDEYQDVNELQDAVFLAISKGDNRFMVGDIKQSIYVFRSARPEIFAALKRRLPLLERCPDPSGNSIFMSENYRCDRGIVDFVNSIFDKMFEVVRESIEYLPEDSLQFAKKYGTDGTDPEPPYRLPEICLVEGRVDEDGQYVSRESEYIAERIEDLLKNGRLNRGRRLEDGSVDYSVHPDDIAILIRTWTPMDAIVDSLEKRGIDVEHGIDREFFMNADVRLVLCLLNAIDNPSKDVYLAGLMCSPLFGFTADDMLRYRKDRRSQSLYRSVKEYSAAHPEDEKLSKFLKKLSHYRTLSEGLNVYTLISRLYDETGVFALASARGEGHKLITLYNHARKYESASYKGLYNFITYLNNIVTIGAGIEEKGGQESTGAVRILTAHGSKGLEFPVVFFADASHMLTSKDSAGTVLHAEGYGIGYYLRDESSVALIENPIKPLIANRIKEKFYEEELRILYVALTRASEQLIVVGKLGKDETPEDVMLSAEMSSKLLSPYAIRELGTYVDIILAASPKAELKFIHAPGETVYNLSADVEPPAKEEAPATEVARDEEFYRALKERFSYVYPYEADTRLPEKMSVSSLYPRLLDDLDEISLTEAKITRDGILPEFIAGKGDRKSAEEGIATHVMLQFSDLERLKADGAERELSRLVEKKFLSSERANLVRLDEIELFRRSGLIKEMTEAGSKIYRELRFNARVDASLIAEGEEKRAALEGKTVLVQGVIDCVIVDPEGEIHLIDYKTDRLTKSEIEDPALARKKLSDAHSTQLSYYAAAIEKMFGKRPKTVRVYSLPLGDCVSIDPLF